MHGGRAKDDRGKLQQEMFKLDIRNEVFMVGTAREVVQSSALEALKARPEKTPCNLLSPQFGLKNSRGPSYPELPQDLK